MTIRNLQSEHLKITSIRHYLYGFTICVLCFEAATGQAINYFRDVAEIITSSHEQKKYAHESVSLLHTYSSQVISVSKDFGLKLLIPLSFLFLVLKTLERGNLITRRSTPLLITFSTLLLFINGFPVHKEDFWNSAGNWIISLSLLNSTFIFLFLKSKIITGTDCVYMLILNWSTLISGIGTNNTIGGQAIFSIVGLIAVTLIILLSLARYLRIRVTLLALLIGIMSFVPSVVHANTLGMYRVAPIKELNSKVEGIKVLRNIYVTDTDAKLYSLLANISATLEKNARVVSVVQPGFNLAFEKRTFGPKWLDAFYPASFSNLQKKCQDNPPMDDPVVIVAPTNVSAKVLLMLNASLRDCRISFPDNFNLMTTSTDDSVSIWKSIKR